MAWHDPTPVPQERSNGETDTYDLLTPERVILQYDLAGIGSRGAALFLDALWQGLAFGIVFLALGGLALLGRATGLDDASSDGDDLAGAIVVAVIIGLFALISWGYFIIFEIVWSGQTPGKRALGLRVLRENGYPIRPGDSIIRNVLRIVDWLPATYAVGMLTMLLNSRAKRLGDFAAGTVVVREDRSRQRMPGLDASAGGSGFTARLSPEEAALARELLLRRPMLQPQARAQLAHDLATILKVRCRLWAETGDIPDEQLLEGLVANAPA